MITHRYYPPCGCHAMKHHTKNAIAGAFGGQIAYAIVFAALGGSEGIGLAAALVIWAVFLSGSIYFSVENEFIFDTTRDRSATEDWSANTRTSRAETAANGGASANNETGRPTNPSTDSAETEPQASSAIDSEATTNTSPETNPLSDSKQRSRQSPDPNSEPNKHRQDHPEPPQRTASEQTPRESSHRRESRSQPESRHKQKSKSENKNREPNTLMNASAGAVATSISYIIPVFNLFGPIFGGFVAGYLQKRGGQGGMKVGGLKGLIMIGPAIPISLFLGGLLSRIPIFGELLAGSFLVVIVFIVAHSIALGVFGGLLGGMVAGDYSRRFDRL